MSNSENELTIYIVICRYRFLKLILETRAMLC